MEDDTGGDPVVVLLNVGAERGPVVVNVEQTDFPVTGWMEIQSATYFVRQTVRGSCVAADAANGGVCARTANQALDKRGRAPAISAMVEVTRPEMISIKDILGGANRYDAVAAVRDELPARVTQARIRRRKTPVRMQVPWQAEPARVEVVRSREDQAARWLHLFAEHWRLLRAMQARTIWVRAVRLRALELGQLARGPVGLARAEAVLAPREPAAQRAQS